MHRRMQNLISIFILGVAGIGKGINDALPVSEIFGQAMPLNARPRLVWRPAGLQTTIIMPTVWVIFFQTTLAY